MYVIPNWAMAAYLNRMVFISILTVKIFPIINMQDAKSAPPERNAPKGDALHQENRSLRR
jgi:hypothetical protein